MNKGVLTLLFVLGTLTFYYFSTIDRYCIRTATSGNNGVSADGKPLLPIALYNCASIHTSQFMKSIYPSGKKPQRSENDGKKVKDLVQSKNGDEPVNKEARPSKASRSSSGQEGTTTPFQQKTLSDQNVIPEQANMQSETNEIDHSSREFVDDNTYYDWGDGYGRKKKGL